LGFPLPIILKYSCISVKRSIVTALLPRIFACIPRPINMVCISLILVSVWRLLPPKRALPQR